jgi:hypothetical protein
MTVRRFAPKSGIGDIVEVTQEFSIKNWRNECEWYEIDVNGNKLPDMEGLIDFWNQHAAQSKAKKTKE